MDLLLVSSTIWNDLSRNICIYPIFMFTKNLFFFARKSASERLIRYTISLIVKSLCVLKMEISSAFQLPIRTHLLDSSIPTTLDRNYFSSIACLWLLCLIFFSQSSILLLQYSVSFTANSVVIICMSLLGSISPSVWVTSGSSKTRRTWYIPSTYLI
jgi:hypothetical protein